MANQQDDGGVLTELKRVVAHAAAELDVVFVHGLTGDAERTFRHENGFDFPRELAARVAQDACEINVWSIDYPAPALKSSAVGVARKGLARLPWLGAKLSSPGARDATAPERVDIEFDLKDRGRALLELLTAEELGTRPVVFVAHSLGGLMVKAMLTVAEESGDRQNLAILEQTRGVIFLATPHTGSDLGNLAENLGILLKGVGASAKFLCNWLGAPMAGTVFYVLGYAANAAMEPSQVVKALTKHNKQATELARSYERIARRRGISTHAFYETTKTAHLTLVVEPWSADPHVGDPPIGIEGATHSSICKPGNERDPVFRDVCARVRRAATRALGRTKRPVFDELVTEIVALIRKGRRFGDDIPELSWESKPSSEGSAQRTLTRIEELPPNGTATPNLRRQFAVEFYRLCEERLRADPHALRAEDVETARQSQIDFDKLVLMAWNRVQLEHALREARRLIEDQCSYVRSQKDPTLTLLYRSIDNLDRVLDEQLPLSLDRELLTVHSAIKARAAAEALDQDGSTRLRLEEMITRIRSRITAIPSPSA